MGQHVEFIAQLRPPGTTVTSMGWADIPQTYEDLVIHYTAKSTTTVTQQAGAPAPQVRVDLISFPTTLQTEIFQLYQPEYNYQSAASPDINLLATDSRSSHSVGCGWIKIYNYSFANGSPVFTVEAFSALPEFASNTNDNKPSLYVHGTGSADGLPVTDINFVISTGYFSTSAFMNSTFRLYGIKNRF